jgi:hypothetical protein
MHVSRPRRYYERAYLGRKQLLGPGDPSALDALADMAALEQDRGQQGKADKMWRAVLAGREAALGKEHGDTLDAVAWMARGAEVRGEWGEAVTLWGRVRDGRIAAGGAGHEEASLMAGALLAAGRGGEAAEGARKAVEELARTRGRRHADTAAAAARLGRVLERGGQGREALAYYDMALAGMREGDAERGAVEGWRDALADPGAKERAPAPTGDRRIDRRGTVRAATR